ncbi:MAG: adenylosuccinate lyase, partial [Planctomycetota bacterium]
SANRRLSIPELFLTVDALLQLVRNVSDGLVVHPKRIEVNLRRELPFLVTETLLMEAVKLGADRQELHESIRVHARAVAGALKEGAERNDLFDRLKADPAFVDVKNLLTVEGDLLRWCGRAPEQVEEFLREEVDPVLSERSELLGGEGDVRV